MRISLLLLPIFLIGYGLVGAASNNAGWFVGLGFFSWIGAVLILIAVTQTRLLDTLASTTGAPPRDGEPYIVRGKITTLEPLLVAPFSGRPCIAYEYDVSTGDGSSSRTKFSGFAGVPASIQGPHGPLRLLGLPDLEGPGDLIISPADLERARAYISRTPLKPFPAAFDGFRARRLAAQPKDRADFVAPDVDLDDPARGFIKETIVPPDTPMTVTGIFVAAQGGLGRFAEGSIPFQIHAGTVGEVQQYKRSLVRYAWVFGLVTLGMANLFAKCI